MNSLEAVIARTLQAWTCAGHGMTIQGHQTSDASGTGYCTLSTSKKQKQNAGL